MSVTATSTDTLKKALNDANLNDLADCFRKMQLGNMLAPLKRTFTALVSSATQDLTAIDGTGETVGVANANRLALLAGSTLRVTAGAAAAGVRTLGDTGATASATVATISDDGKTLTFEAAVTGFVIEYVPRSTADMASAFARL